MAKVFGCVFLVLCLHYGTSQPVQSGATLTASPAEVLFRVDDRSKPLVLECTTEGKTSDVKYRWYKNGKPFEIKSGVIQQKDEGTLVFLQPKKEDEGKYRCFADTEHGTASTRVIAAKNAFIDKPKVTLKTHNPIEGKPYKLECGAPPSYPRPEIKWMYQFKTDSSISHSVLDKRITQSPDGYLWFSNVTKEDTHENFKYVCLAVTPASDDEVVLAEHVIESVAPGGGSDGELVQQYVSEDMVAKVGKVTMIYCIYGGTPLAHPDWYKDGKNVNNQPKDRVTRYNRTAGKRLLIRETWPEDQGSYTCIVDNEVGQPMNHTMFLTVVSAPNFNKPMEQQIVSKKGQDIKIPCEVAGVPTPKIIWTYNAKPLPQNGKNVISQKNSGNVTVADLTIKNVQEPDAGYYGCAGANENGDVYAETLLLIS